MVQDFEQLRAVLVEHGRAFIKNGTTDCMPALTNPSVVESGASGTGTIATFGDRFLNDGMVKLPKAARAYT